MIDLKKRRRPRYKVLCYYGGEFQDEIRWAHNLLTAKVWSRSCEHCEVLDTYDNDKLIDPYEEV